MDNVKENFAIGEKKMINKLIPQKTAYQLKQLGFLENKKLYEISEDILKHFIEKNKEVLSKPDEPLKTFSVRIDKQVADNFATLSKKMGIRQDRLLQQAIEEYIKDKKLKIH